MSFGFSDNYFQIDPVHKLPLAEKRIIRKDYGLKKKFTTEAEAKKAYEKLPVKIRDKCEITEGFDFAF